VVSLQQVVDDALAADVVMAASGLEDVLVEGHAERTVIFVDLELISNWRGGDLCVESILSSWSQEDGGRVDGS
jgi:hypothetical protein